MIIQRSGYHGIFVEFMYHCWEVIETYIYIVPALYFARASLDKQVKSMETRLIT